MSPRATGSDAGPRDVIVVLLGVLTGGSVVHNVLIYRDREGWGRILGGLLSVLAVVVLLLTAIMLRLPVWGMGLVFLSLLAGSLVIGFATVGLSLGHWYLVTPAAAVAPAERGHGAHAGLPAGPGAVVRARRRAPGR